MRYSKENIDWLFEQIGEYMKGGKVTVEEACEAVAEEWRKRTGSEALGKGVCALYYRYKAMRSAKLDQKSVSNVLKPGEVVIVQEKGNKFSTIHPDMDSALGQVNGKVENFEFWAARKLRVGYKTTLVVSADTDGGA